MRYRPFGPTGYDVSIIGMGTWYIDAGDRQNAIEAIQSGLDAGMNHIDTAEMYGDAEILVGEAIRNRRDDVFLVSKVLPQHASRSETKRACERSLRRIGTDWLDCYLLHWRGPVPLEETIAAFVDLESEGKIRSWGISNFDTDDLEEAYGIASGIGETIACDQVLYHLKERAIEHAVLPWCARHGVAVTAYSPFGHGDFPDTDDPGGRVLQEIADAYGATPMQVALAFLVRHPTVFAIPKASTPAHAIENAAAGDLLLSENDLAVIDRAFPRGPRPRTLPMI
ncbi:MULTISPECIES: aldo/keto reductase [Rhodomicrobium]|uniref:aldo/keto reductase n=1 Tax=Rhodomicrobium TaxID=1068 RepID=UPI000B4BDA4B|nr:MULTISPECIES: aldo/keto reductase [Rhodomicrobium]